MSEPQTDAGRALLDGLSDALGATSGSSLGSHGEQFRGHIVDAVERGVFAIEQEARAGLRAELAAKVEALGYPLYLPRNEYPTWSQHAHPNDLDRAAVLDIIRGDRD